MEYRYQKLAEQIADSVRQGVYQSGERLPGVRKLAAQFSVSISTVLEALRLLEEQRLILARPRSGYFVCEEETPVPPEPEAGQAEIRPPTTFEQRALHLLKMAADPSVVPLGAAVPHVSYLPRKALARITAEVYREQSQEALSYAFAPGQAKLRQQLARRMKKRGVPIREDRIVVTTGCQEALNLSLRAVTSPGDVVAIESPSFYGILRALEAHDLRVLEIPTHPRGGISIGALNLAASQWDLKACLINSNFSNPLGASLTTEKKQRLAAWSAEQQIPLIEDDICGDLAFSGERPDTIKQYDKEGWVMYCSSFSKSLSPGLRVGWVEPGRFVDSVEYLKYISSLASGSVDQLVVARFLETGAYDRYLRDLRGEYARAVQFVVQGIARYFPEGTRVSRPSGGFVLWVELPPGCSAMALYEKAMQHSISIVPGPLFSAQGKFQNCIRLNCALPRDERLDKALLLLGRLAAEC